MIRQPTVFVLGAGASVPYGFPSGEELMRTARSFDLMNLEQKIVSPELHEQTVKLHRALQQTHDSSIDALLELRPDITDAGKRLIASLMLELEFHSPSRFPAPEDDWLTVFFEELALDTKSLEDFASNPITIVTYNYDRLLEYRLVGALQAHYGRSEIDCIKIVKNLSIIHLHGDLGTLPGFAEDGIVPFGPDFTKNVPLWSNYVWYAAGRIVIVHQATDETEDFQRARGALSIAKQIVFLGFGFGARNLERLRIDKWSASRIIGTTYGMTNSRFHYLVGQPFTRVRKHFPAVSSTWGAREFLDNGLNIFRD